jgi:hypothetical protein
VAINVGNLVHSLSRLLIKTLRPSAQAFSENGRAEGLTWPELLHVYAYAQG